MAVGDSISATTFNNLQGILTAKYGPNFYGFATGTGANQIPNQVIGGNDPATSDTVLAADVQRLFSIGQLINYHHTGSLFTGTSSTTYSDFQDGQKIFWADWGESGDSTGLYQLLSSVNSFNRYTTEFGGDFTTANNASPTLTTSWNVSAAITYTYTWTTSQNFREFFTTGGELRIVSSMTNIGTVGTASYDKNLNWQTILSNTGTVRLFMRPNSTATGYEWVMESLSGGGTGSLQTTTTNAGPVNSGSQYVGYTRNGSGTIYNDNQFRINVTISSTSVTLNIQFLDGDTGTGNPADGPASTPIDESVTGDLTVTSTVSTADSTITLNDGTTNVNFSLQATAPTVAVSAWASS